MKDLYLIFLMMKLKRNEKKSREAILKIREKKFRKLLKHAYRNSPFYRESYSRQGITEKDLATVPIERLPVTTKKILMDNFDRVVTKRDLKLKEILEFLSVNRNPLDLYKNKYQLVNSSGSSGSMGVFVYSLMEFVHAFSCSTRMHLFEFNQRNSLAYYAGVDERFGGVSLVLHGKRGILKKMYDICLLDMNEPIAAIVARLNEFQPAILIGYGSGLVLLAKMQQQGKLKISPRIIENGGEGLSPEDYRLIRQVFGVPIVNMYASSECYYLGLGKDEYDGIYLMDDFNYIEIMDDHILITNLYNYTQPIIRYRIDDRLVVKEDKQNLLPFRLVESVIGRDELLLWFTNDDGQDDYIHPVVLTSFFVKGLNKFQIFLKSRKEFIFSAVLSPGAPGETVVNEITLKLKEMLTKKKMNGVTFKVELTEHPRIDQKSRKFKMIHKDYA